MDYVTYDTNGKLTGAYHQDLNSAHTANYITVTPDQRASWVIYQANAARSAVELAPAPAFDLANAKSVLIVKIDADVDAIYQAVVGNRSDEYVQAFNDSTAFKAAGYSGTVPASVQSWATAKGWTATQSADDILVAAGKLATLRDNIRAARLLRKEQARTAADATSLATVSATWTATVSAIRTSAGV